MHVFEPRLLMPGTPGAPSHIALAHEADVYDELANPRMSASVYVPRWSQPVKDAFARLAAGRVSSERNFEEELRLTPALLAAGGEVEDFALESTIRWLRPAFLPNAREENMHVVQEVAGAQAQFVQAAVKLLAHQPSRNANFFTVLKALDINEAADTRVNLKYPERSLAHTDPGDTGLFSAPLGTVLVDQANLDIKVLRQTDTYTNPSQKLIHRIALTHLANRLWQIPDGAFALWRGEPHPNAQFHFFPEITQKIERYRAFAHP